MEDREIEIIETSTRNEKIKNFFSNNFRIIISLVSVILLIIFSYLFYKTHLENSRIEISNKYNITVNNYDENYKDKTLNSLIEVIMDQDKTYAPLALYFIIENDLSTPEMVNKYFDIIINEIKLDKNFKYLNIYKKAIYNSDFANEDQLLDIINPILKEENIWREHALFLMGEYYFSKNEKQKSKEFYIKILDENTNNSQIKLEAQKRLQRDFSE